MKEQFVTYEIALKLKELSFDEECMGRYEHSLTEQIDNETGDTSGAFGWEKGETTFYREFFKNNHPGIDFSNEDWVHVAAPLWQQVIDWVREKYGILVNPVIDYEGVYNWAVVYPINEHEVEVEDIKGDTWYNAREKAVSRAIELCKQEQLISFETAKLAKEKGF